MIQIVMQIECSVDEEMIKKTYDLIRACDCYLLCKQQRFENKIGIQILTTASIIHKILGEYISESTCENTPLPQVIANLFYEFDLKSFNIWKEQQNA